MDKSLTKDQAEEVMAGVSDLIDDPKYRPYFFKRLYQIGVDNFLEAAALARKDGVTHKGRKFASLLRYRKNF